MRSSSGLGQIVPRIAIGALVAGAALASSPAATAGAPTNGTLYFTTFNDVQAGPVNNGYRRVHSVDYSWDGSLFALTNIRDLAQTPGADGLIFNPLNASMLFVGDQGNSVSAVNLASPAFPAVQNTPDQIYHLSADPTNLNHVYGASIPGNLDAIPVSASGFNGTPVKVPITGDDTTVTTVVYTPKNGWFYTASGGAGIGNFGHITFSGGSAITTRISSSLPAAHGMAYDAFSGDLILFGDSHITQIDPSNPSSNVGDVFATAFPSLPNSTWDQGAVDGMGHLLVANNGGNLGFIDYSSSGHINGSGSEYRDPYLAPYLDDVAPLSGVGSQHNPVPEPAFFQMGGMLALGGLGMLRRRRR